MNVRMEQQGKLLTEIRIEHNKELRTLFEHMVNDLLDRYNLKSDSDKEYTVRKTIFI